MASKAPDMSQLRFLDDRKPTWRCPDDEIVEAVITPALQVADRFDCMVGSDSRQPPSVNTIQMVQLA